MDQISFCINSSNLYLHYLPNLLRSIDNLFNDYNLSINLVQPKNEQIKFVSSILLKNCRLIEINKTYPKINSIDELNGFSSNLRAKSLFECAKKNNGIVVYLDVNIILLRSFKKIISKLKGYDVAIIIDQNHWSLKKVNYSYQKLGEISKNIKYQGPLGTILKGCCLAGIQIYKINKKTRKFLYEYYQLVSSKPNSWFCDQEALAILYLKYKKDIKFLYLEEDYVGMENYFPNSIFAIYRKKGKEKLYDEFTLIKNNKGIFSNLESFSRKPLFQKNHNLLAKIFFKILLRFKLLDIIYNFLKSNFKKFIFFIFINSPIVNKRINNFHYKKSYYYFISDLFLTSNGVINNIRSDKLLSMPFFKIYIITVPRNISKRFFESSLLFRSNHKHININSNN